jgi:hypothetical protein
MEEVHVVQKGKVTEIQTLLVRKDHMENPGVNEEGNKNL